MPASRSRPDFQFDTVLNAVDDLGMDPTGSSPIDSALSNAEAARTLIEFPPGTYLLQSQNAFSSNHFGIRGTGQTRGDVVFTVSQGTGARVFNFVGDHHQLLENCTFDQLDDWNTKITLKMKVNDAGLIKDVHHRGWEPNGGEGSRQSSALSPLCMSAGGQVVVDNYRNDGKRRWREYPNNNIMVWVGGGVPGRHVFINCHFENSGEHAIYGDAATGPMEVENCVFKNNQNTQMRISGQNSFVRNSVFIWGRHPNGPVDGTGASGHGRSGLTWASKFSDTPSNDGLVENCDFVFDWSNIDKNTELLEVGMNHSRPYGGITVRNCRFALNDDSAPVTAIQAEDPSRSYTPSTPHGLNIQNCHFTGLSRDARGIINIEDRDSNLIEGCCLDMGGSADGVVFVGSSSGTVRDSSITVGGERLVGVSGTNISTGETCEVATTDLPTETGFDHRAVVQSNPDIDAASDYQFTTTGEIALVTEGEDAASPGAEEVHQNADGTWTATGRVGFGGADSFEFNGDVTSFSFSHENDDLVGLFVDGFEVQADRFGEPDQPDQPDGGSETRDRMIIGSLLLGGAFAGAKLREFGGDR